MSLLSAVILLWRYWGAPLATQYVESHERGTIALGYLAFSILVRLLDYIYWGYFLGLPSYLRLDNSFLIPLEKLKPLYSIQDSGNRPYFDDTIRPNKIHHGRFGLYWPSFPIEILEWPRSSGEGVGPQCYSKVVPFRSLGCYISLLGWYLRHRMGTSRFGESRSRTQYTLVTNWL